MSDSMEQMIAVVGGLLIVVALTPLVKWAMNRYIVPRMKGPIGEFAVNRTLRKGLPPDVYHLIPNVILPTGVKGGDEGDETTGPGGTTQIDHVVVSRYGIFVIETKAFRGWIYGKENEPRWTQKFRRKSFPFQNPLRQNYRHTKTLSDLTSIPHEYFTSLVAFGGEAEFKTPMPPTVVHVRDLAKTIRGYTGVLIQDEQVPEIVAAIRAWADTVDAASRSSHVKNLKARNAPVSASADTAPSCPRCNSVMVLKSRRKDGGQFWGCPTYPKCSGTRQVG